MLDLADRLRETQTVLRHETSHESLTGRWSRRSIFRRLEQELPRAERDDNSLAAVIFDLDLFKLANDNHGHPVGD